jgi:hypothetical protein
MVLGHGSGIDDILLFVIPVGLAILALRAAEKRAKTRIDAESAEHDQPADEDLPANHDHP